MKVTKINESFSWLDGNSQELKQIHEFLKVEVDNANFDPLIKSFFLKVGTFPSPSISTSLSKSVK